MFAKEKKIEMGYKNCIHLLMRKENIDYGKIKSLGEGNFEWMIPNYLTKIVKKYLFIPSPNFPFEKIKWHVRLYPKDKLKSEFVDLYLINYWEKRGFSTEYRFGLKRVDGRVEELETRILKEEQEMSESNNLIKISELERRRDELLPSDTLTVVFSLKREGSPTNSQPSVWTTPPAVTDQSNLTKTQTVEPSDIRTTEPSDIGTTEPLDIRTVEDVDSSTAPPSSVDTSPTVLERSNLTCLEKLSENFRALLDDKESSDVILKVKNTEFKAHRTVLMARSSVFGAMFKHRTLEKQTGVIEIPDCDEESFNDFLQFVYCGKIENMSIRSAKHLYETSDKYDIQELKTICVDYLIRNLTVETLCEVAVLADMYEETELFSAVQLLFNEHAAHIFGTSQWNRLMKDNNRLADKLLVEMSRSKLLK